ncbi:GHKL domain-containing protein [Anaerolentibacter hominis]|uniref:GHKL domain-containing protein n=1 Tax=Anaerolentibacter hominis TaxID=3079009 RepID=UPI0031B811E5
MKKNIFSFPIFLLFLTISICAIWFCCLFLYGNKYTYPGTQASQGVLNLQEHGSDQFPLRFLWDGWEFYQYKTLTPDDFARGGCYPDAYLFLGQYGGFELGDLHASPHGTATYRLTLFTTAKVREYTLELPEIFSSYVLWINGKQMKLAGVSGEAPAARLTSVTFEASEKIEIIVNVRDSTHLYSGMVYPPAFGQPEAVERLLSLRLILASAACTIAVLVGLLFFLAELFSHRALLGSSYLLLCFGYTCSMGRIAIHALGQAGEFWYTLETAGLYAMILALFLMVGCLLALPGRWFILTGIAGSLICLWVILFPLFFMGDNAQTMIAYSRSLMLYKWLSAAALLAVTGRAVHKRTPCSYPLFLGVVFFASTLILERLFPLYEPVLCAWPLESAGFLQILILAGVLVADFISTRRQNLVLRERELMAEKLAVQQKNQYQMLAGHLETLREMKHDMRSSLITLKYYCDTGQYEALSGTIAESLKQTVLPSRYCANPLINAILSNLSDEAGKKNITAEFQIAPLPSKLPIEDGDLCSLLDNLFQNALDACTKIPASQPRGIRLELYVKGSYLHVQCKNTKNNDIITHGGNYISDKPEPLLHGIGLKRVRAITRKYQGYLDIQYDKNQFYAAVILCLSDD